ncbi:aKG-HExxH-type peptide beta-hydroxylase [Roseateles flavus]|uniref:HEXXH motif-containing putative peptide modification protein n=1 Tax=Roseateles flavus TaxID=3149041 RepID=A0ABV0GG08_9BURK
MPCILVGPSVSDHVFTLSQQLKASAVKQFQAMGSPASVYVPWIAAGTDIKFSFPESLFAPHPSVARGRLINDASYLQPAHTYVQTRLEHMQYHEGLMPGARDDWLPAALVNPAAIHAVDAGVDVLLGSDPSLARLYTELVEFVLPLGDKHRGYSNANMRGILFRGIPDNWNAYDVAIDLAHELGHHTLFVWQSVDPILASSPSAPVLSSVRKVERPAIQSFHGAVALAFMLFTTQTWTKNAISQEAARRHGSFYIGGTLESALSEALDTLRAQCEFTAIGKKMVDEMQALLQ